LASVHGIIHAHRGAIRVQSRLDKGSTFTVVFPAVAAQVSTPKAPSKPEDLRGSGRILVVDDEDIALCTMRAILERNGYQVLTAENGQLAVDVVREHKG
jgi:two-component system cell cycle sensor histidine kinase/response regulator CckA